MHTMHTRERNSVFPFIYKGFRAFSKPFLYASPDAYRCIHAYKTAGRTSQCCKVRACGSTASRTPRGARRNGSEDRLTSSPRLKPGDSSHPDDGRNPSPRLKAGAPSRQNGRGGHRGCMHSGSRVCIRMHQGMHTSFLSVSACFQRSGDGPGACMHCMHHSLIGDSGKRKETPYIDAYNAYKIKEFCFFLYL